MLKYKRPPIPKEFQNDACVEKAKQAVETAIANNQTPTFQDCWTKYKQYFYKTQHGKCGYCDCIISEYGDVEHYAPKAKLCELTSPGRERPDSQNVEGRKFRKISETGYWWLAYEWSNYLLSCRICNSAWKRNLFPVMEYPRHLPPSENQNETPLLLNPYHDDPMNHLEFGDLGQIIGKSEKGRKTIEVCGLDRESLRSHRYEKAIRIYRLLNQLAIAKNESEKKTIIQEILDNGIEKYAHSGMVRLIIFCQLNLTWNDLEDYLNSLES